MRKTIAILMLLLFLFNLVGYRAWFSYLQQQSEQQLITSLDKNEYSDADLITIKVPISLPYFNNWADFERYDGSIEIDGQHYNYVKRKVCNDTLVLLCIPNTGKNRLNNAQTAYENLLSNERPSTSSKEGGPLSLLKLLISEYRNDIYLYPIHPQYIQLQGYTLTNDNKLCRQAIPSPWQPPDIYC